jgi:hypothetical protein
MTIRYDVGMRTLSPTTLNSIQGTHISAVLKHGFVKSLLNPDMDGAEKLAALGEEFGEVCREFTYDAAGSMEERRARRVKELLQLAALAAAWAESIDAERTIMGAATLPNAEDGGESRGA